MSSFPPETQGQVLALENTAWIGSISSVPAEEQMPMGRFEPIERFPLPIPEMLLHPTSNQSNNSHRKHDNSKPHSSFTVCELTEITMSGAPLTIWNSFKMKFDGASTVALGFACVVASPLGETTCSTVAIVILNAG
jgi:hypothetical protein